MNINLLCNDCLLLSTILFIIVEEYFLLHPTESLLDKLYFRDSHNQFIINYIDIPQFISLIVI